MAVIGVASIRVRPDLTQFRRELTAGLAKINVELKVPVTADTKRAELQIRRLIDRFEGENVDLDVRFDTRKMQSATADLDNFKKKLGEVGRVSVDVSRSIGRNAVRTVAFGVALTSLASTASGAITTIGGLGTALASMSAGLVGLAAGGAAAAVQAFAVVKLGAVGMGDAFKAVAEGDAAALSEALKKMAPAGREFVTEVAKLKPLFDELRLDIQQELFKGLGTEVSKTGKLLLGIARQELPETAGIFREMAKEVLTFIRQGQNLALIRRSADNVNSGFREMVTVGRNITSILIDLVSAGTDLLPELGRGVEDVTAKFAAWIRGLRESGELTQFFRDAISEIKQFGRIIRDFGVGISNVFKIASGETGGFLNTLERTASAFREWTESIGGQLILSQFFGTIRMLSEAFGRLLSTLKPVLGPLGSFIQALSEGLAGVLDRLGPKIRDTLISLFENLEKALPSLLPAIEDIIGALLDLVEGLGPLIPILADMLKAFVDIAGTPGIAFVAILALIGGKMGLVVAAGVGLGLLLIEIGKGIKSLVNDVGDGVEQMGKDLQKIGGPTGIIGQALESIGKGMGDSNVREVMRKMGVDVGHSLIEGVSIAIAKGNAEILAPGVNSAIDSIAGLFGAKAPLFDAAGRAIALATDTGLQAGLLEAQNRANAVVDSIAVLFNGKTGLFDSVGRALGSAFGTGLSAEQQKAVDAAKRIVDAIVNLFNNARPNMDQAGRSCGQSVANGLGSTQTDSTNAAKRIADSIAGIFNGVSLNTQGQRIGNSLYSGLSSALASVKTLLQNTTSQIPSWKGPEDVDRKLLVPAGKAIMDGLITSIDSKIPELESTLRGVTGMVGGAFDADPTINSRPVISNSVNNRFDPTPVVVDLRLNEGVMSGLFDARVTANNRTINRFTGSGVQA